jgi:hypothetical protein
MALERYGAIVAQRTALYAQVAQLRDELRHEQTAHATTRRALTESRTALEKAEGLLAQNLAEQHEGDDAPHLGALEPGFSPLDNLDAWRRGQLGL